eukprot:gene10504-7293_t
MMMTASTPPPVLHCAAAFTWLHRRHHCRHCGQLVCGSCSNKMLPLLPSSAVSAAAPLTAIQCTDGLFTATVSPVSLHGGSDGDTPGESQSSIGAPMQWCRVCDRCYTRLTALPPRRSQLPPEAPPRPSSPLQGVVLRPPCPPAPLLQCPSPESAQPIRHLPVVSLAPSALERQARRRRSICVLLLDERSGDDVGAAARGFTPSRRPVGSSDSSCSTASDSSSRLYPLLGSSTEAHAHSHTPEYTILRALVGSLTSDYRDMADDSFHFACSGRAALLPAPAFLCSASAVSALTSRSAKGKVFAAPEPGVQRWEMEVFHAPITVLGAAERLGRRQRLLAASALGHAASLPEATERFPSVSETLLGRLTKIPCSPTSFVLVVLRSAGGELMRQRQDGGSRGGGGALPRPTRRERRASRRSGGSYRKYGAAPHMSVIDVAMTVDGLAESPPANLAVLEAMNDLQRRVARTAGPAGCLSAGGRQAAFPGVNPVRCSPGAAAPYRTSFRGELAVHIEQLVSRMILRDEELYQNEIMNSLKRNGKGNSQRSFIHLPWEVCVVFYGDSSQTEASGTQSIRRFIFFSFYYYYMYLRRVTQLSPVRHSEIVLHCFQIVHLAFRSGVCSPALQHTGQHTPVVGWCEAMEPWMYHPINLYTRYIDSIYRSVYLVL